MLKDNIIAIILWAILLGFVAVLFIQKIIAKNKFKNVNMDIDKNWYENSLAKYPDDNDLHAYYFHHDKNFFASGHVMEDKNHNIIYEAKFLYNNVTSADEVDFINHIIYYKSHHKIGHTVTSSVGGDSSIITDSSFSFDGIDIYEYLKSKGYSHTFNLHGLAYTVNIYKADNLVATLYSSNNGKNYFEAKGYNYEAKMGGTGLLIVESDYKNLDAAFLYAIAFARSELSVSNT